MLVAPWPALLFFYSIFLSHVIQRDFNSITASNPWPKPEMLLGKVFDLSLKEDLVGVV